MYTIRCRRPPPQKKTIGYCLCMWWADETWWGIVTRNRTIWNLPLIYMTWRFVEFPAIPAKGVVHCLQLQSTICARKFEYYFHHSTEQTLPKDYHEFNINTKHKHTQTHAHSTPDAMQRFIFSKVTSFSLRIFRTSEHDVKKTGKL